MLYFKRSNENVYKYNMVPSIILGECIYIATVVNYREIAMIQLHLFCLTQLCLYKSLNSGMLVTEYAAKPSVKHAFSRTNI